jgi:hypothetical protein
MWKIYFGRKGRDENPLYHCKNMELKWSTKEIYFDFHKNFVSIVRVCCFGVFIIFSSLDFNSETSYKYI